MAPSKLFFIALQVGAVLGESTNPSHYGDPKTGCESDEMAVRVQGLSGDFCSPQCTSSGSCATDVPAGDTAKPGCVLKTTSGKQYCALKCDPSAFRADGANGECGTGTCQSISGIGLCTYATSETAEKVQPALLSLVAAKVEANPTHYGDPKTGCESDEMAVRVQGLSGDFCSPQCTSAGSCATDVPSGDTAKPECKLKTTSGKQYCALICDPSALRAYGADGECGTGKCQSIGGIGICTYPTAGALELAPALLTLAATESSTIVV